MLACWETTNSKHKCWGNIYMLGGCVGIVHMIENEIDVFVMRLSAYDLELQNNWVVILAPIGVDLIWVKVGIETFFFDE